MRLLYIPQWRGSNLGRGVGEGRRGGAYIATSCLPVRDERCALDSTSEYSFDAEVRRECVIDAGDGSDPFNEPKCSPNEGATIRSVSDARRKHTKSREKT